MHCSDIHKDLNRLKNIVNFANEHNTIDALLHTGDMTSSHFAENVDNESEVMKTSNKPFRKSCMISTRSNVSTSLWM